MQPDSKDLTESSEEKGKCNDSGWMTDGPKKRVPVCFSYAFCACQYKKLFCFFRIFDERSTRVIIVCPMEANIVGQFSLAYFDTGISADNHK